MRTESLLNVNYCGGPAPGQSPLGSDAMYRAVKVAQAMQANNIFVYSIGMGTAITGANNAVAEEFLREVANDPNAATYNPNLPQGEAVFASTSADLQPGVPGYRVEDSAAPFEVIERGSDSIVRNNRSGCVFNRTQPDLFVCAESRHPSDEYVADSGCVVFHDPEWRMSGAGARRRKLHPRLRSGRQRYHRLGLGRHIWDIRQYEPRQ